MSEMNLSITPTPGAAASAIVPKDVVLEFDRSLQGAQFLAPPGAAPPPPSAIGQREEGAETIEPNAQSKKPDFSLSPTQKGFPLRKGFFGLDSNDLEILVWTEGKPPSKPVGTYDLESPFGGSSNVLSLGIPPLTADICPAAPSSGLLGLAPLTEDICPAAPFSGAGARAVLVQCVDSGPEGVVPASVMPEGGRREVIGLSFEAQGFGPLAEANQKGSPFSSSTTLDLGLPTPSETRVETRAVPLPKIAENDLLDPRIAPAPERLPAVNRILWQQNDIELSAIELIRFDAPAYGSRVRKDLGMDLDGTSLGTGTKTDSLFEKSNSKLSQAIGISNVEKSASQVTAAGKRNEGSTGQFASFEGGLMNPLDLKDPKATPLNGTEPQTSDPKPAQGRTFRKEANLDPAAIAERVAVTVGEPGKGKQAIATSIGSNSESEGSGAKALHLKQSPDEAAGVKASDSLPGLPFKPAQNPDLPSGQRIAGAATENTSQGRSAQDREKLILQISDRIELLAASKPRHGVTIHLEPRELGTVTLTVKSFGSEIEARVTASDDGVRAALVDAGPQLHKALESKGFQVNALSFDLSRPETGLGGGQTHRHQPNSPQHNSDRAFFGGSTLDEVDFLSGRLLAQKPGGMDIRI